MQVSRLWLVVKSPSDIERNFLIFRKIYWQDRSHYWFIHLFNGHIRVVDSQNFCDLKINSEIGNHFIDI